MGLEADARLRSSQPKSWLSAQLS